MLVEAALLILCLGHGLLIYGCYDMRKDRHSNRVEWTERAGLIKEILEDIVDAVDGIGGGGGGSPSAGPAATGGGLQEILTGLVMNRVAEAAFGQHGSQITDTLGAIPAKGTETKSEVGDEPIDGG